MNSFLQKKSLIVLILFLCGCSSFGEKIMYLITDHFDGKHFYNSWGVNNNKTLLDVIKWKLGGGAKAWPSQKNYLKSPSNLVRKDGAASVHVTYIGQATVYIQDSTISILTDPHFSDRASPVSFVGPKRYREPALTIEQIPTLNLVLISHNHYDHMDIPSLVSIDNKFKPEFLVPLGNAKYLKEAGIQNVVELDWWQVYKSVQLVPAQHWSARGFSDRNESLWGGFVIKMSSKKIYFAGDTGYGPHFKMIKDKCGEIDLSLLPIGAYEPRDFMKDQHMNPEDAVFAHLDLKSKKSFAIHFETFQMTDEAYEDPRHDLSRQLTSKSLGPEAFFVPQLGETFVLK